MRLEIAKGADPVLLEQLLKSIDLDPANVYTIERPINMARLMSAYDLIDRPELKFKPFAPYIHPDLEGHQPLFKNIAKRDYLLHQPYDSFQPFIDFISQAAHDPQVFAIKQTLYRTSGDSPIVQALIDASRNGKQVTVLVELKARFDEANNIKWARQLEDEGVHVVYGMVGLKTHCKTCMVVRREGRHLRRYAHLGTGNYNPKTAASTPTLASLPPVAKSLTKLPTSSTPLRILNPPFQKLLVAPFNLHQSIQRHINTEA